MESGFQTEVTSSAGGVSVRVLGDVDVHTAARLGEQLGEFMGGNAQRIVVDLSGVPFCDSTGITVLVNAANRLHASGRQLVIRDPSTQVRRVLEVTGLTGVFQIEG